MTYRNEFARQHARGRVGAPLQGPAARVRLAGVGAGDRTLSERSASASAAGYGANNSTQRLVDTFRLERFQNRRLVSMLGLVGVLRPSSVDTYIPATRRCYSVHCNLPLYFRSQNCHITIEVIFAL